MGDEPGAEIGCFAPKFGVALVKLAETARARPFPPMWRFEAGHSPALLIDENRRARVTNRRPERFAKRADLIGIGNVAGEQDEAEWTGILEEAALIGKQFGSLTAINRGSRRHPSLIGSAREYLTATQQNRCPPRL